MSDERQTMFVIAFGVSPAGGAAPGYLAPDGSRTDAKSRAAKFHSFATAQQFAAYHRIGSGRGNDRRGNLRRSGAP